MEPALRELLSYIGANVRTRRVKLGLSQAALAEAIELDLRFLQRVERGQTNLSVAVLVMLGAALRCPPEALFRVAVLEPARPGRPPSRPTSSSTATEAAAARRRR